MNDPEAQVETAADRGRRYCQHLEEGHILFFPHTPFPVPEDERAFLLNQRQVGASYHKNIAYRPHQDRVTGFVKRSQQEEEKLKRIMRAYSQRTVQFLRALLPLYDGAWRLDYASFRPQEEQGRDLPQRSRNDLLHVDAFPTRPTNGDRILRIFTNINRTRSRCWITSDTFEVLAKRLAGSPGFPSPMSLNPSRLKNARASLVKLARWVGLPLVDRPPYDEFMLRFHHALKKDREFQSTCEKQTWEFPPGSTWIVFTDMVSHAALSGQYVLEQTVILSPDALALPEKAPVNVLQRLAAAPVTR